MKKKAEESQETIVVTENNIEIRDTDKQTKKGKKTKKEKKPLDKAAKKKRRRIILCSILGVIVLLVVVLNVLGGDGAQAYVTTTPSVKGEIEQTINTSGTVTTEQTKVYFSDVSVKIGSVEVEAGDAVSAGDVLIAYDAADIAKEKELAQLKVQSAEGSYQNSLQSNSEKMGDLQEANVNLEVLDQQIADTESYIDNLEAKIAQKQSDIAYEGTLLQISLLDWKDKPDSDEYLNLQKLIQINNYEQQNNEEIKGWQDELEVYNEMLADYKEYRSEMKSQKSSAEAGKLTSGAKEELEATSQTNEIQAKDSLDSLEAAEAGIVAEFNGVVTEVSAVSGSSVAAGTQLLKLESTEDVMVKISVTKYDLDKIAMGQKAVITVGGKEYEGEVSKINKMAEKNASGAAVVGTEIKILNPDSDVILGVEAKVIISTAQETDAVLVPTGAVNVDMEGEFVYVVENNILVKKRIVTGISSDTMVQVTEGLAEGEQLVTDVTTTLEEGMTVMVMPQMTATE
ncbi:MAG: efflux RND transporter periplasmic adaptor subunit [Lachnospiraceae bacterium]|nr:efflux RND transporter periplasmic adaptor subunit [Lachnospiraceae bacterium]